MELLSFQLRNCVAYSSVTWSVSMVIREDQMDVSSANATIHVR